MNEASPRERLHQSSQRRRHSETRALEHNLWSQSSAYDLIHTEYCDSWHWADPHQGIGECGMAHAKRKTLDIQRFRGKHLVRQGTRFVIVLQEPAQTGTLLSVVSGPAKLRHRWRVGVQVEGRALVRRARRWGEWL
jgi:hypothetical protein